MTILASRQATALSPGTFATQAAAGEMAAKPQVMGAIVISMGDMKSRGACRQQIPDERVE